MTRSGKEVVTASEVDNYVGGGANNHIQPARVKLTEPDVTVTLQIVKD
ncbi:hypothetical protein CSC88_29910, partial [Klebsiella pneumoniae]